jgi:hypothetical protein
MPPPVQCHLVALAVAIAAGTAILLGGMPHQSVVPGWLILAVGCGYSAVFLLRGTASYTRIWQRLTPEEPFRTYDRRYYAPLCLLLGMGFVALTWQFIDIRF